MPADYSAELLRTLRDQMPVSLRPYVPDEHRLRRYLPAALIVAGIGALAYVVIDAATRREAPEPEHPRSRKRRR